MTPFTSINFQYHSASVEFLPESGVAKKKAELPRLLTAAAAVVVASMFMHCR